MNTSNNNGRSQSRGRRSSGKRRELLSIPKVSEEAQALLQLPLSTGSYVVFDIETTGGNPERNGITEIFAVRYKAGEVMDTFYSMVNPGIPIPPIVRRMTGINNQMVRGAPRIDAVMPGLLEFVGRDVLVSHNTIGDMKFLRHFAKTTTGIEMENFYLCTHLLVEKLAPESPDKSLRGLAKFFELSTGELHRAEADAYVTLDLFKVLLKRLRDRGVDRIDAAIRLQGDLESSMRLGWSLEAATLAAVPPGPGVFSLYDQQNKLMFLSSALHLHREVGRLRVFDQLPRPLLRLVLKASDLQVSRSANGYAALLEECQALEGQSVGFHPSLWHQRTIQTIFVAADGHEVVVGIGPIMPGTTQAYGPVRDRRVASELLDYLAESCGVKHGRHGVRLPRSMEPTLNAFFRGELADRRGTDKNWRQSIKQLFSTTARREASTHQVLLSKLKAARLPPRLTPIFDISGVVVVPETQDSWQVHQIARAMPFAMAREDGNIEERLWRDGQAGKYAEVLKQRHDSVKVGPLTEDEANRMNATLWWIYNGKFEGRFWPIDELNGAEAPLKQP